MNINEAYKDLIQDLVTSMSKPEILGAFAPSHIILLQDIFNECAKDEPLQYLKINELIEENSKYQTRLNMIIWANRLQIETIAERRRNIVKENEARAGASLRTQTIRVSKDAIQNEIQRLVPEYEELTNKNILREEINKLLNILLTTLQERHGHQARHRQSADRPG
jgi:archaellum component FlaC